MLLVSDTFSPPRGFLCCAAPFSPKDSQSCTLLQSPALGPHSPPDPLRQHAGFLTAASFIFCMHLCPFVYTQVLPPAVGFSSLVLCILRTPRFSLSPHLELQFKNANKTRHYFDQALQDKRRTLFLLASPLSHPKGPPPLPLFFHSPLHSARNEHLLEPPDENKLRIMIATDNHVGILERDPVRGPDSFAALEGR